MRRRHITASRLGQGRYAPRRACIDQKRQHIRADPARNPHLPEFTLNRARTDTAGPHRGCTPHGRDKCAEVRLTRAGHRPQRRKRWPELEVAVQHAGTHRTVGKSPTPGQFVWIPVQTVRGVRLENLQAPHRSDLGRNAHQIRAVKHQTGNRGQLRDRGWQRDDLSSLRTAQLHERLELRPTVRRRLLDQRQQVSPTLRVGILLIRVEGHARRPGRGRVANTLAPIPVGPIRRGPDRVSEPIGQHRRRLTLICCHQETVSPAVSHLHSACILGCMGIWVGVLVFVIMLGLGALWVTRGGKAGRAERLEWRQLCRAGRRELRQHRRENGRRVNGAAIARQRAMQADQLPFSMPDGG